MPAYSTKPHNPIPTATIENIAQMNHLLVQICLNIYNNYTKNSTNLNVFKNPIVDKVIPPKNQQTPQNVGAFNPFKQKTTVQIIFTNINPSILLGFFINPLNH